MEKSEPVIFVSAPNYKLAGKKNIEVEEILNAPFYLTAVSYTHLASLGGFS